MLPNSSPLSRPVSRGRALYDRIGGPPLPGVCILVHRIHRGCTRLKPAWLLGYSVFRLRSCASVYSTSYVSPPVSNHKGSMPSALLLLFQLIVSPEGYTDTQEHPKAAPPLGFSLVYPLFLDTQRLHKGCTKTPEMGGLGTKKPPFWLAALLPFWFWSLPFWLVSKP